MSRVGELYPAGTVLVLMGDLVWFQDFNGTWGDMNDFQKTNYVKNFLEKFKVNEFSEVFSGEISWMEQWKKLQLKKSQSNRK